LFKTSFAAVPWANSTGWATTQLMLNLFTNFAATGNPGIIGWEPSTGANDRPPLYGYNIRETRDSIGALPEAERMEVWDTFYEAAETGASNKIKLANLIAVVIFAIKMIL
jgi:hypothetical protein